MPLTRTVLGVFAFAFGCLVIAQDKSVKPGINDSFKNPNVKDFQGKFEVESREVAAKRDQIIAAMKIQPGMVVADIGAGTGLFTRPLAKAVGPKGRVYAVDIAPKFLEHIQKTARAAQLRNVTPVLCGEDSVDLPPNSVDLVYICDVYHHFEFPQRSLESLIRAIKPGGRLVVVDFVRIPGKTSEWLLKHVRAGQEVFEKEITDAGFQKMDEVKGLLTENYMVVFTKPAEQDKPAKPKSKAVGVTPVVPGYGAVVPLPDAVEPPAKGMKVVLDVTAVAKDPADPIPGLARVAGLLNLAGLAGLKPTDLEIAVVLHGDATAAALTDSEYRKVFGQSYPHAELIKKLKESGVKVMVCGQSLARKGYDLKQVRSEVKTAASATSALVNHQSRGFAYIPAH